MSQEEPQVFSQPPPDLVSVSTIAPAAVEVDAFVKAAAHLAMFEKLRTVALKLTRPTDWHQFGERPWPMRGAVEKISRALGLNIAVFRTEDGSPYTKRFSQDEKGAFYVVTVSGTVSGPWGTLEAMGFCTSRDQFFASDGKDANGEIVWKPFFEIKEENIIQSAYTNFVANAVMRYTGISAFTKADLDQAYGAGAVSGHVYAESKPKKTAADTDVRSAHMKELAAICMVMADGVESEAGIICESFSSFTSSKDGKLVPGKRSPRDLSDGRLNVTVQTARKEWESFLSKSGEKRAFLEGLLRQRIEGSKPGEEAGQ
jgi:hypothetical protein